jgi:acyl-coenzyme A synthetase/AMP-(fatty) acid ligase
MALELELDDGQPLQLSSAGMSTRGAVMADAQALAEVLRASEADRVLLCTDEPARLVAAIVAANQCGADLWVAPGSSSLAEKEGLLTQFEIRVLIDESTQVRPLSALRESPAAARIHLMTSGTTGQPKVAAHTLDSLLGRVQTAAQMPSNRGSRWLLTYQTSAFAGLQVVLTAVMAGGVLIVPAARTPQDFFIAAQQHAATHISGTPTFWRSFSFVATPGALPDLRQITLGGESVDQHTLDRLGALFPSARITHIYASTEAGAVFAVHDGCEGFPAEWLEVGVGGTKIRIRDGVLELRSTHGMQRYASQTPSPYTKDGWLHTGDVVAVDGGRVRFLGRKDDVINVGGAKVHPHSVESFLLGLEDVREARVRGVANPISGFIVGAEVVLSDTVEREGARERILSECFAKLPAHQVPRKLSIVDEVKVLVSGKKG